MKKMKINNVKYYMFDCVKKGHLPKQLYISFVKDYDTCIKDVDLLNRYKNVCYHLFRVKGYYHKYPLSKVDYNSIYDELRLGVNY